MAEITERLSKFADDTGELVWVQNWLEELMAKVGDQWENGGEQDRPVSSINFPTTRRQTLRPARIV